MTNGSLSRGTLLLGGLVLIAGCLGALTGGEPLAFTASKATVGETTLAETGFEPQESRTIPVNRTIEVLGGQRRVELTNHLTTYSKPVQDAPGGIAIVLATPKAKAFGQALNPLGHLNTGELLEQTLSQTSVGIQNRQAQPSRTATILGTETEIKQFSATIQRSGQQIDASVYVVRVAHKDDFVIGAVIVPKIMPNGDSTARTLLRGIKH